MQKKKKRLGKETPHVKVDSISNKILHNKEKKRKSTPSLFYFKGLTAILKASNKLTPYFH